MKQVTCKVYGIKSTLVDEAWYPEWIQYPGETIEHGLLRIYYESAYGKPYTLPFELVGQPYHIRDTVFFVPDSFELPEDQEELVFTPEDIDVIMDAMTIARIKIAGLLARWSDNPVKETYITLKDKMIALQNRISNYLEEEKRKSL